MQLSHIVAFLKLRTVCKVSCELLDEIRCEFQHGHIVSFVECLYEGGNIISCSHHNLVCPDGTVFTHTFQEVGAILVECLDKCLVFAANTLVGIAYHFSSYKRFTVGYLLVVLDDLHLDVVQCKVDVPCLLALAFRLVPFHVPKRLGNALLATELRYSPVDCHSFYDGNNSVFLLVAVHVEQHLECTSAHV